MNASTYEEIDRDKDRHDEKLWRDDYEKVS